jgi:membrane protease YdiL (CAAX protease family)
MTAWDSLLLIALAVAVTAPLACVLAGLRGRPGLLQGAPGARRTFFVWTMGVLWASAGLAIGITIVQGTRLDEVGLGAGHGGTSASLAWTLSIGFSLLVLIQWVGVRQSTIIREKFRARLGRLEGLEPYLPSTPAELRLFTWVGITAGVTEEIIFRGFMIGMLSGMMPVSLAATLSLALFVSLHRYQGAAGMIRVGFMGALLTAVTLLAGSVWPAILLHSMVDVFNAKTLWCLRHLPPAQPAVPEACGQ